MLLIRKEQKVLLIVFVLEGGARRFCSEQKFKFSKPTLIPNSPALNLIPLNYFSPSSNSRKLNLWQRFSEERMISLYPNPSTWYSQVSFYICPHPLSSKTKYQASFRHSYYFLNKRFSGVYSLVFVISRNSQGFKSIHLGCITPFVKLLLYSLQT